MNVMGRSETGRDKQVYFKDIPVATQVVELSGTIECLQELYNNRPEFEYMPEREDGVGILEYLWSVIKYLNGKEYEDEEVVKIPAGLDLTTHVAVVKKALGVLKSKGDALDTEEIFRVGQALDFINFCNRESDSLLYLAELIYLLKSIEIAQKTLLEVGKILPTLPEEVETVRK